MTSDPVMRLTTRAVERVWGGSGVPSLGLDAGGRTIGEWWLPTAAFPVLVKVIDAREVLSVQLHPDDATAAQMDLASGKSEAWYVLAARPGAAIFLGLRDGVAAADFLDAAERGEDVSALLGTVPARPGDVLFVPPGTVHAIGAGITLLEVQQDADVTFRLYDWGRLPARELHIPQARRALRFDDRAGRVPPEAWRDDGGARTRGRLHCEHFALAESELEGGARAQVEVGAGEMWFCAAGTGRLAGQDLAPGSFHLLRPGGYEVQSGPGVLRWLRVGTGGP